MINLTSPPQRQHQSRFALTRAEEPLCEQPFLLCWYYHNLTEQPRLGDRFVRAVVVAATPTKVLLRFP